MEERAAVMLAEVDRVFTLANSPNRNPEHRETMAYCENCGDPFRRRTIKHRFCCTDCRRARENTHRKTEKRMEQVEEPTTDELPEPAPEGSDPPLPLRFEMSKPHWSPALQTSASCSIDPHIWLPWMDIGPEHRTASKMYSVCLECPILPECAMNAQRGEESGTWAAATMVEGRARMWMCPECKELNGAWDICRCGAASMTYRAKATRATRTGENIQPRKRGYGETLNSRT